jgi:hypothetical protein
VLILAEQTRLSGYDAGYLWLELYQIEWNPLTSCVIPGLDLA